MKKWAVLIFVVWILFACTIILAIPCYGGGGELNEVVTTGWIRQNNGTSKVIDLSAIPRIENPKVRFRGVTAETGSQVTFNSNSGILSIVIPAPQAGSSFYNLHEIAGHVHITNETGRTINPILTLNTPWGTYQDTVAIPNGTWSGLYVWGTTSSYYGGSTVSISVFADGGDWVASLDADINASTRGIEYTYDNTRNPRATVNGVTANGPSSLGNNTVSAWYNLNLIAGQQNTVAYQISGSGVADVEISYEIPKMNMRYKIGGVWKQVTGIFYKVNGEWKEAEEGYIKENGIWKRSD